MKAPSLKNCIVIRDSKGKQKGYTVATISGSVNKDGSYEETSNSKQVLDTPQAVLKNILSDLNIKRLVWYGINPAKATKADLQQKVRLGMCHIYDLTAEQKFVKQGWAIPAPQPKTKKA